MRSSKALPHRGEPRSCPPFVSRGSPLAGRRQEPRKPSTLFEPRLLRARPHHTGLFVRAEAQLPVESLLVAGAEPEQLDALQIGMVQNALHDLGPDLLALIGRIHD